MGSPVRPPRPTEPRVETLRAGGAVEAAIAGVEGALDRLTVEADEVSTACSRLEAALEATSHAGAAAVAVDRLVSLARTRRGAPARALLPSLTRLAERAAASPRAVAPLLQAADPHIQRVALAWLADAVGAGALAPEPVLADRLAAALGAEGGPLLDPASLAHAERLLDALGGGGAAGRLIGADPALRLAAAHVLDREPAPAPAEAARRVLGEAAAAALAPLLAFTRARHVDLVALAPVAGEPPPALPSLLHARAELGEVVLGEIVGRLGWEQVAWGLRVEPVTGVSVDRSLPLLVPQGARALLEACDGATRAWDRVLIIAHGGRALGRSDGAAPEAIARFRRYNLLHAEVLADLLEVAPLGAARARRIVARMDAIVAEFEALFGGQTPDAADLRETYERLRCRILAALPMEGEDRPLSAETTRRVQMFEDPRRLDEVRTLHGLKRHLHQAGLRYAFRLFCAEGSTNRTVDLLVLSEGRVIAEAHAIRYLDFEPDATADPTALPAIVSRLARGFGRHLLHGWTALPHVKLLLYGNEVQTYVNYRNHPAFLRLDLSPPLRGGMIDLEYFGVSQYELGNHPDPSLPTLRALFQNLEMDFALDGLRVHARYDKERAFTLAALLEKADALFRALPLLMDLDWTVGGLRYPEAAKRAVGAAWVDFLGRWGVLPFDALLTADRRRVLRGVVFRDGGRREIDWDGHGAYVDRLTGAPPLDLVSKLKASLEARGLAALARWETVGRAGLDQLALERAVFTPLAAAVARGEVCESPDGPRPCAPGVVEREHEARWFASVLVEGGPALERALDVAAVVPRIERSVRFQPSGAVQQHAVERAVLALRDCELGLFVLRDTSGFVRLAMAARDATLSRRRAEDGTTEATATLDATALHGLLRANNYLDEGPPPARVGSVEDLVASVRSKAAGARRGTRRLAPVLDGVAAAPGRAAGLVRFGIDPRPATEFEGAVLVAPAVRPEDAPRLRSTAAIVSTGGGALSHAGLIAQELGKPALIVPGEWVTGRRPRTARTPSPVAPSARGRGGGEGPGYLEGEPSGVTSAPALVCRSAARREETTEVGGLTVVCGSDFRVREVVVQEGDLVVVDADARTLTVLGQSPDALALHAELRRLAEADARLVAAGEPAQRLALRGDLLRAAHQLGRLLGRLDAPALAAHAVAELLRARLSPAAGEPRRVALRVLLDNPRCNAAALEEAIAFAGTLAEAHDARRAEAAQVLATSRRLHEILAAHLEVRRVRAALADAAAVLASCGVDAPPAPPAADLDEQARARLEALELELVEQALRPAAPWLVRHLERRHARIARALGAAEAAPSPDPPPVPDALRGRLTVGPADGGAELAGIAGGKAANLGEVARIVGAERVPAWFAMTDASLRQTLAGPPGRGAAELRLSPAEAPTLDAAITAVLRREETPAKASSAIRRLWEAARLPPDVADALDAGYASLRRPDEPPPALAVRSSTREEDSERAAWAGAFDTFLFVTGHEALHTHLKLAWAGMWTERALCLRMGAGAPPGGGVVIQRIVDARASGVLHTAGVAAGQHREMVINVGLGLGEGVVSGTVEVDQVFVAKDGDLVRDPLRFRYVVGEKPRQVVRDPRGSGTRFVPTLAHQRLRPALEYVELAELVALASRLEDVFGQPLDVEFALEADQLYLLQVRPIVAFGAMLDVAAREMPLRRSNPREAGP